MGLCMDFLQMMLVYDSKAGQRGGWEMHAVAEMQVMGLMLNRCDSVLERQSKTRLMLVENTTKERAGARYTPEKPFPASHGDGAKTLVLNSISEHERRSCKFYCVHRPSKTGRVHNKSCTG